MDHPVLFISNINQLITALSKSLLAFLPDTGKDLLRRSEESNQNQALTAGDRYRRAGTNSAVWRLCRGDQALMMTPAAGSTLRTSKALQLDSTCYGTCFFLPWKACE
jgi:hypothetical protein